MSQASDWSPTTSRPVCDFGSNNSRPRFFACFFLELGSVVLSSSWLNRLLALKLQWWEISPCQALGKFIGLLWKEWGFLTNIPTQLPALGKARRFPGCTRYMFQCTSMSNTSNDAEDKGSSALVCSRPFFVFELDPWISIGFFLTPNNFCHPMEFWRISFLQPFLLWINSPCWIIRV